MTLRRPTRAIRGSALLLVMILLLVMSLVAASAVTLSSQERIAAAAQTSYDALVECATAAQARLWAAAAQSGASYYAEPSATMVVTSIRLADGRELMAPAHIDATGEVHPSEGIVSAPTGSPNGLPLDDDTTNTILGGQGRRTRLGTWVVARCTDSSGRQHEVEFAFRFSL